jgi:TolB-like protein/DNA-binding winged helix-turn-helix (wHTH) protein/Tfp pilus assembly protein PilF
VSSRKLRFDGWVLDPESGDLERNGTRLRLQEQPVQVLRELIAHAGSVVSREQLIALLWPKGVVDFDTGLNTVIRKLRSALGDTSETPRYIETLPRRGYRFIGALDPDPEAPAAASPAVPPDTVVLAAASGGSAPAASEGATSSIPTAIIRTQRPRLPAMALIGALAAAALLAGVYALWRERLAASATSVRVEAPPPTGISANVVVTRPAAFSPPARSIAVLPFVNISGDKEQEYFSDGLTEELLNSLTHVDGLQVAARTSSFSFREHPDIADVARKLNVATVLEGSVRRSGQTIRITAQLNDAVTGFHLWSQTYDRDLSDVLKLQTEIANAVANALKIALLRDVAENIELGGTRNPQAFDAYLQASKALEESDDPKYFAKAIAGYSEAIHLDPHYALAFAYRSIAWTFHADSSYGPHADSATIRAEDEKALADARHAIALAPQLAEGHLALHLYFFEQTFDFTSAKSEIEQAFALAPGNAGVLERYGRFYVLIGRTDAGLAAVRRAVLLDPLNEEAHYRLAQTLHMVHRFAEAVEAWSNLLVLNPQHPDAPTRRGFAYYELGDLERARASCEMRPDDEDGHWCLAIVYHGLGRYADAEAEFSKLRATAHSPYLYAEIYAHWGDTSKALDWLESAWRLRDPDFRWLKADPSMDSLRKEPRYQAIERALKFPD